MFCTVDQLRQQLERTLGYSDPMPTQTFKQTIAGGDDDAIRGYPLLGNFKNGNRAIWVKWAHAPKIGSSGVCCLIEPMPQPGSGQHHNWVFDVLSIGEGAEAGLRLQEAFRRIHEVMPAGMHVARNYEEQNWQGFTYSVPRRLTNGPFDYGRS